MRTVPITQVADVIRSKNSGPFELTLDIMFKDRREYELLKEVGFFTPELIARLYGTSVGNVLNVVYFDPSAAVKATLVRPVTSGSPGDADVYGAQQHAPLLTLEVPIPDDLG